MSWIEVFNLVIGILFTVCYSYQIFYLIVGTFVKPRRYPVCEQKNRYAIMIAARNEEKVIGQLCDSIREQDYPKDLVDIYVIADNCTDFTAEVARAHGAFVYERQNKEKVGKGYALEMLFENVQAKVGKDYYDGFFIFDADNLLDEHYISAMDRCANAGNKIITSYRNSKNYGDNWISSGYALWFIREARHLNNARSILHTSSAVSGTGFYIAKEIINRQGGWKHFLLTEDIEFTVDNVVQGEKVAFCYDAMFYDEQPVKFSQSWRQRKRWAKGMLQIVHNYSGKLFKGFFSKNCFSCYDMAMTTAPAFFLTVTSLFVNIVAQITALFMGDVEIEVALLSALNLFVSAFGFMFIVGIVTGICEWKKIHAPAWRKILSFFTFPLFMFTYLPISVSALFSKVEWKPIEHNVSVSTKDVVRVRK